MWLKKDQAKGPVLSKIEAMAHKHEPNTLEEIELQGMNP
jgi:hypothetical protein